MRATAQQPVSAACRRLTLNLMPFIVTSSHSWPTLNLLLQDQFGMDCVHVKSFPSCTTSVITLWSVLALRSPVTGSQSGCLTKNMTGRDHFKTRKNNKSAREPAYRSLPGTPRSSLDSPARTCRWKPWRWQEERWNRRRRQMERKKKAGVAWGCYCLSICAQTSAYTPHFLLQPHHVTTPSVCVWMSC